MNEQLKFICVGAQKAGTSTLHDILKQHPDLQLPIYKETHFFRDDEVYEKGLEYYFNHFFDKEKRECIGEIDPEYAYFEPCAQRIWDCFGAIKIIFILRNPVDRAFSHYRMSKGRGLEDYTFSEAVETEENRLRTHYDHIHFSYCSRGKYWEQIERFQKIFGTKNVAVYKFEDLIKDSKRTVESICNFVGLSPFEFDYSMKSNQASTAKSKWLRDFIYRPNGLKKAIGKLIPSKALKDKIMMTLAEKNKKPANKETLSNSEKEMLYKRYFIEEVALLENNLGLNLGAWKYD